MKVEEKDIKNPYDWISRKRYDYSKENREYFEELCRAYALEKYNISRGFEAIFNKAYEDGHSDGITEIFNKLNDYTVLVLEVICEMTDEANGE